MSKAWERESRWTPVAVLTCLALAGCGDGGGEGGAPPPESGAAAVEPAESGAATPREALRAVLLDPAAAVWSEPAPDVFNALFETGKGSFTLEIHRAWAPIGVDHFYNLIRHGYYDDSRFFRVVPDFIVQFGIPGDPEISAVWRDRTLTDDPVVESNVRGTLAFAMTGPDTRTTQLYISLVDLSRLDEQGFAPLGRVVEGMEVVDALYSGYGEDAGGGMRRGQQDRMMTEGNAHLDADFPLLDRIERVRVEPVR